MGLTHVHEGNVGASGDLTGVDATLKIDEKTRVKAEFAGSQRNASGANTDGNAWKVEALREDTIGIESADV